MGTNYAIKGERFQNLEDGELHIGKKSAGWVFAFQSQSFVDPRTGIEHSLRSLHDYYLFLQTEILTGETIVDEYGRELSRGQFVSIVERSRAVNCHEEEGGQGGAWIYRDNGIDFILGDFS